MFVISRDKARTVFLIRAVFKPSWVLDTQIRLGSITWVFKLGSNSGQVLKSRSNSAQQTPCWAQTWAQIGFYVNCSWGGKLTFIWVSFQIYMVSPCKFYVIVPMCMPGDAWTYSRDAKQLPERLQISLLHFWTSRHRYRVDGSHDDGFDGCGLFGS